MGASIWTPGSTTTAVDATFDYTATYPVGTVGNALQDRALCVTDYPFLASGDGITDDTAAILAAQVVAEAEGSILVFPAGGTYLTQPIVSGARLRVYVERGATVKLLDSASTVVVGGQASWAVFVLAHSNCELICDGVLDGNRANQDKAGFATAGGGNSRKFHGVIALGTSTTPITGLRLKVNAINVAQFALSCQYVNDFEVLGIDADDCGGIAEYNDCERFKGYKHHGKTIDHDGWRVFPHSCDVFRCRDFNIYGVSIADHAGYGVVASNTSLSAWVSGCTVVASRNGIITFGIFKFREDTACQKSLAMSFLGNIDVVFSGGSTYGYTDTALEFGGNLRCRVVDQFHDGGYRYSTLSPDGSGTGVQVSQTNFALEDDDTDLLLARALRTNTNCELVRVRARRHLGHAFSVSGCDGVRLIECEGLASYSGIIIQVQDLVVDSFPDAISQGINNLVIDGGEFSFNETHGSWGVSGSNVQFANRTILRNNGQGYNYPGQARRKDASVLNEGDGYTTGAGVDKSGWVAEFPRAYDDQTTTGSKCSLNPATPTIISVSDPKLWNEGQVITIIGGGVAAADLTTMIDNVDQDNLTLRDALSTFPTVAGTGTISTSGRTITGVGTALNTEIPFRAWIVSGGIYRQVIRTTSTTAGQLAEAFPTNLSGAAFSIVSLDCDQVRSQRYGIQLGATMLSPLIKGPDFGPGNKTDNLANSTLSTSPAIILKDEPRFTVLASSAAPSSHTGDLVDTVIETVTIPGGTLARNGVCRITAFWSHTNNANNKTLAIKVAGTALASTVVTTTATTMEQRHFWNVNSVSVQKGGAQTPAGGFGSTTAAAFSGANNTANDLAITFTALLGNAADTITLEAYTVEVLSKG